MAKEKKIVNRIPRFQSEAEEADWWASEAGQRFAERKHRENKKRGTIYAAEQTIEVLEQSKREGKTIRYVSDPVKLAALISREKAKAETESIALRVPVADLAAAKRIAARSGIGYQTLLKAIIHEAVQAG